MQDRDFMLETINNRNINHKVIVYNHVFAEKINAHDYYEHNSSSTKLE